MALAAADDKAQVFMMTAPRSLAGTRRAIWEEGGELQGKHVIIKINKLPHFTGGKAALVAVMVSLSGRENLSVCLGAESFNLGNSFVVVLTVILGFGCEDDASGYFKLCLYALLFLFMRPTVYITGERVAVKYWISI